MDWDGDGLLDIIVGDREGSVYFFRRLSIGDIFLAQEPRVAVAGKPIDVGLNSSPSVTDWNGDGLPDLVVGRLEGLPAGQLLYINEGSPGSPVYNYTDTVTCGGEPIQLYANYPDFGDLDGDGLPDMIIGNTTGRIPCYINSGTPDQYFFVHYEELRADGEVLNLLTYIRPSICDWNEDGVPDLMACTWDGAIRLYLGIPGTGTEHAGTQEAAGIWILEYANPVNQVLAPEVRLGTESNVTTTVHSVDGRLLMSEESGLLGSGDHRLTLDVSRLPQGVYLCSCTDGSSRQSFLFTVSRR